MGLNLDLPLRNEVCDNKDGKYYGIAYYGYGNAHLGKEQFFLGNHGITDPLEAIEVADDQLSKRESGFPKREYYAAGVHIGRVCLSHDNPQAEIVLNAVVVTDDLRFKVTGAGSVYSSADGDLFKRSRVIYPDSNDRSGNYVDMLYLPQADLSAVNSDHQGLISRRGGTSNPLWIGLAGQEVLVPLGSRSDTTPDYC